MGPGVHLFDRRVDNPIGVAAGPLPNSRWVEAYARLGYGLLTYNTVRSAARAAYPAPNLVHCGDDDPAIAGPAPRPLDPARLTWAVSFGLPSAEPDVWRADVGRAKSKIGAGQLLIVSVVGTPAVGVEDEQLADDYARCARWAADAGADVIELQLSGATASDEPSQRVFENPPLAAHVVDRVRRAVGPRPLIAKLGAARSPRALHELASRLAPRLDGFTLVGGIVRPVVTRTGTPAFRAENRLTGAVVGAGAHAHCQAQVEELLAWRRAGAWSRVVLAVGGLTTVDRLHGALAAGADAAMVATAALADPLICARFMQARRR